MDSQKSKRLFGSRQTDRWAEKNVPARDRSESRLDEILRAAAHVIARDGYEKASMRAIAKESGASLAGLYHYFKSKEDLLFLIQFRTFSALLTEIKSRLHGVDDPMEQLRLLVRTHVSHLAETMAALKVCSHELDSLTGQAYEQVRNIRREYYELVYSIVGKIVREYAPDSNLDVRVATMCLFGMLNWIYRWYDAGRDRSPSTLANQIFNQFLGGLLRTPADDSPKKRACPRRRVSVDGVLPRKPQAEPREAR